MQGTSRDIRDDAMSGHTPWSQIKHKRMAGSCDSRSPVHGYPCFKPINHADVHESSNCVTWGYSEAYGREQENPGKRPFPHLHEGRGPRCLACGESRSMHPGGNPVVENDARNVEGIKRHTRPLVEDAQYDTLPADPIFNPGDRVIYRHFIPGGELATVIDPTGEWERDRELGELVIEIEDGSRYFVRPNELELAEPTIIDEVLEASYLIPPEARRGLDLVCRQFEAQFEEIEELRESRHALLKMIVELGKQKDEVRAELSETRAQLASCNVQLHDQQKHELGRQCAEQQDKLDKLEDYITVNEGIDISSRAVTAMMKIIDGTV